MWAFKGLIIGMGATVPSKIARCNYSNFAYIFRLPQAHGAAVSMTVLSCRNASDNKAHRGSIRSKKKKERREKEDLEHALERDYGIKQNETMTPREYLKRNYFTELLAFEARLSLNFHDTGFLMSAFAHPSFTEDLKDRDRTKLLNSDKDLKQRFAIQDELSEVTYDRLGLLGHETTALTIKEELHKKYPSIILPVCNDVSNFLMSRDTISMIAKQLAIDDLLLLSPELDRVTDFDQELNVHFSQKDLLCDTFFAVVGAITLDGGIETAKSFVRDFLVCLIQYEDLSEHVNVTSEELLKKHLRQTLALEGIHGKIEARTIVETGMNTDFAVFYVGVYVNGVQIGAGSKYSAQTARRDAYACALYSCLEGEVDFERIKGLHASPKQALD